MALEILEPTSEGNYTNFGLVGGGTKTIACSDDNDATYLAEAAPPDQNQSFHIGPMVNAVGDIVSVKTYTRAEYIGGVSGQIRNYGIFAGPVDGALAAAHVLTAAWVWYTSAALARPGGGAWLKSDFTPVNAEIGCRWTAAGGGASLAVSEFRCHIQYNPPPCGFFSIISSILGAVLGSNLQLSDMPGLIAMANLASWGKHVIYGSEALQLFTGLVNYPHRRYVWQS